MREKLFGHFGIGGRDCRCQRRVERIDLAVEDAPDQREREAARAEVTDTNEAFQVLRPVEGDAPLAGRRGEEPALLVEADRVDGDLGPAGKVLDPPALLDGCVHEPAL